MTKTEVSDVSDLAESKPQPTRTKKNRPQGRVIIYGKWCKGCGICVAFCPQKVLEQAEDGSVLIANPDKCTACRWCELHCPDFAITVKRIDE